MKESLCLMYIFYQFPSDIEMLTCFFTDTWTCFRDGQTTCTKQYHVASSQRLLMSALRPLLHNGSFPWSLSSPLAVLEVLCGTAR